MKKLKKSLLPGLLAGALVITGCSATGLTNGDVYISTKDGDITQKEVLEFMGEQDISKVATELVMQKVLLSKYKDRIDENTINTQISELEQQLGGKDKLEAALKSQGTSLEKYKNRLKLNFAVPYMILDAKGIDDAKIAEQAEKEKSQYNLAHILITVKSDAIPTGVSDEEAKAKIDEVKAKLDSGANFAELAKEYSTDTSNSSNGGELGWSSKESTPFVKEFADVAYNTEKGKYSDIVKTQFGYHIIKVLDTKEVSIDEVKTQAVLSLAQKAIAENPNIYTDAIKKLFEEYNVKGNTDAVKTYLESMLSAGSNQAAAQLAAQAQQEQTSSTESGATSTSNQTQTSVTESASTTSQVQTSLAPSATSVTTVAVSSN
ncbi:MULTISPECIES: peptidylprolyl isomerase [unclassified Gemella]|uniref:peptidylprolyl isomerase n=1 Tax=unclassified Gemella TaxID=2624949 RepID=UPI00107399AD|nr:MULTISPECIES: peptidylprolyl isomerase [unclassified Gemella]MBF0709690.1 peptidylprolyl isomerase [Gemella sp. GL1.1]MBF0746891.1 peptidylprolyl isomerase [Gemella sp. 19428wG2_WT2a]NYS27034.1 peptidylprolyl isomerase [Gemella sp. GL1]TFU59120.1 peptidylprolyl isomerase [Gemella sp. WT2a]